MPELIAPSARLHSAWLEAHHEWGPGPHEDGFGLGPSDEVGTPDGFAAWVTVLSAQAEPEAVAAGHGCTYRWIVEGDRVHGGIALRLGPADHVQRYGHIGYGVRPSSRRRGLATWALGRMVGEARRLGLDRVLVICEAANTASARTIERNGGVLEDGGEGGGEGDGAGEAGSAAVRRYRITIT
ncbi:GNAT family N-acetyltransferase [Streptomyces sp. NPDC005722]